MTAAAGPLEEPGRNGDDRIVVDDQNRNVWRLGVVSYLNARPLIAGLDLDESVKMLLDVPARLANMLDADEVDVALVPVVDLLGEGRDWQVVSDACIGCDGETLTVRVFSRAAPAQVRRLYVDGDSHTSVALARVLWRERYGCDLEVAPFGGLEPADETEGVLLIGDKVVNHSLIHCDVETDLGAAWKSLTALPFVFAVWASPCSREVDGLAARLASARDRGVESAHAIAADLGPGLGWPVALAQRYLTSRLKFTLGERQRMGMAKFFELARAGGVLPTGRELVFA